MNPTILALEHTALMLETNNAWREVTKWLGNAFIIISALVVSFSVEMAMEPIAFLGFLLGHITWFTAATIMRDKALIALNGFFLFVDSYAIFIRL